MRFRDQRETAVMAIMATGKDERQARRIVHWHNKFPHPQSTVTIGRNRITKRGKRKTQRPYFHGQAQGGKGSVFSKPRNRLRGNIPPHPLAVIVKAHKIEREGERLARKALAK